MGDETKFTADQFLLICQRCFDPDDKTELINFLQGGEPYTEFKKILAYGDLKLTEDQFTALRNMAATANFSALEKVVGIGEHVKAVI